MVPQSMHMSIYTSLLYDSLNITFCQRGATSLMLASDNGHVEVVDKLLQHGARVDLQDEVLFLFSITHSNSLSFLCKWYKVEMLLVATNITKIR